MDNNLQKSRLENLTKLFPLLIPTARKLNENSIDWMIAGSGALYLNGNERQPKDIDIFLLSAGHDKADQLFEIKSFIYTSELENVRNSNPDNDHSMQLTSDLVITKGGVKYQFGSTKLVLNNRTKIILGDDTFYVAPVEEALLIKALLGRGADVGKNDIQDIRNFLKIHPDIDRDYILKRQAELGLEANFWEKTFAVSTSVNRVSHD